jgi:hypothetical protein
VAVPQHRAANAEHQRPVALDQGGEGGLVVLLQVALQQVGVGQCGRVTGDEAVQAAQDGVGLYGGHDSVLR